ncbi:hypothetical protein EV187_2952 [Agromyces ramosus]|uniref:DoxX-like protein n=1 Tax=Agromyces ramosus TaxID=33879 RepID=A0A4Q7M8X1_9MICO|nr:hypothetical protein EV187_2952 [Agromyces ramosus]
MSGLLRIVLIVHGIITLAAAVMLAVLPAAIPATVGIELDPEAYLLSYFLAAAELAIAMLSLGAIRMTDPAAVGLIVAVFVVFHLSTAVLELVYLASAPVTGVLIANIAVRVAAAAIFVIAWRRWRRLATTGVERHPAM